MEEHYYQSWVGTWPQFKSLKAEVEEMKRILGESRQAEEFSEDGISSRPSSASEEKESCHSVTWAYLPPRRSCFLIQISLIVHYIV